LLAVFGQLERIVREVVGRSGREDGARSATGWAKLWNVMLEEPQKGSAMTFKKLVVPVGRKKCNQEALPLRNAEHVRGHIRKYIKHAISTVFVARFDAVNVVRVSCIEHM